MWNIIFLVNGLIFIFLLLMNFFSKDVINTKENSIFKYLIAFNIIEYLFEITMQIFVRLNGVESIIVDILAKIYLVFILIWCVYFSVYTFVICLCNKKNEDKMYKYIRLINIVYGIVGMFSLLVLPMQKYYDNTKMYVYGSSVDMLKLLFGICMLCWLVLLFINFKKLRDKKYLPIIAILALLVVNVIIQSYDPSVLITSMIHTFVCYTMYFTIENPDLKMVNELYKNKNIMEQTYIDKSNFLFEMTEEVRDPMFNISNICNEVKDSNNIKDYKKAIETINKYSKQLDYIVNDVLNVNSLEASQIKFIDNKYNPNLIFDEIINQSKKAIKLNVGFTDDIEKDIPILYGDSIKLKQIVTSLLLDSARRTSDGFIDFKVNTIRRFDALRLIIEVKDSSKGLPIDVINEILNTTASLDQKDIELLDKNELNLDLCQKVIKLMGGNLLIKSTQDKVTEMILTIDQKIYTEELNKLNLEKYITEDKKVVIVNPSKKQNEIIKSILETRDIKSIIYLNSLNLIDDIKSGKEFKYIILGNNMKPKNGYTVLKELQEIKGFITPVGILLENDSLKDAFIKDGFNDVILLESLEEDLEKAIN